MPLCRYLLARWIRASMGILLRTPLRPVRENRAMISRSPETAPRSRRETPPMPTDRLPDLTAPATSPALDPDAVARNLARHAEISADSYAANTKRALEGDTRLFHAR